MQSESVSSYSYVTFVNVNVASEIVIISHVLPDILVLLMTQLMIYVTWVLRLFGFFTVGPFE